MYEILGIGIPGKGCANVHSGERENQNFLHVKNGKIFKENILGQHTENYDSMIVLSQNSSVIVGLPSR